MTRARPLNLTAALAVVAVADLALHRLVGQLFLPQHPTGFLEVLGNAGRFAFHLGGVLGLVVVVVTLLTFLRRADFLPRSMRFAFGCISLFFVATEAVAVLGLPTPLAEPSMVYLVKVGHSFVACFIALALWRVAGPVRAKAGVTLFALPAMLHALALFFERVGFGRAFASELAHVAEICALSAGALSPILLSPEPASPRRGVAGAVAGVLTLGVLLGLLVSRFDLVQTLALYGFRLDLPPLTTAGAITYVAMVLAAFVGLAIATVWCLLDSGPSRLVGYGLVLVGAAGYQTLAPTQVLFATCGLLALAAGAARPTPEPAPLIGAAAAGL